MKKILTFIIIISGLNLSAQQSLLQSGPMLGYSEMKEVMIWIQTKNITDVKIAYWPKENPNLVSWTNTITTEEISAYTAKLIANQIEPGKKYGYKVYLNNIEIQFTYPTEFMSAPIWRWRGDAPDFTFATGSCAYINEEKYDRPGDPYGSDYHIFESIYDQSPDLMIWLGDNLYLREADWNSKTGINHRYTHTRSIEELQPLLASTHHYAIWDDHDYGPNNSDRGFWNKNETFEAFKNFWGNPSFGIDDIKGAITSFQYSDVDFFLLDNRFHRSPNNLQAEGKTILGKKQLQWLKDALVTSEAKFKIVAMGGQFLSSVEMHETYSNNNKAERDEIIKFIYDHNIKNIIFLSGDRHFTELSLLKKEGKPNIYDLTVSAFTSGENIWGDRETNDFRQEGTLVMEHNFSLLKFTGTDKDRKIIIKVYNAQGKHLWEREIVAE